MKSRTSSMSRRRLSGIFSFIWGMLEGAVEREEDNEFPCCSQGVCVERGIYPPSELEEPMVPMPNTPEETCLTWPSFCPDWWMSWCPCWWPCGPWCPSWLWQDGGFNFDLMKALTSSMSNRGFGGNRSLSLLFKIQNENENEDGWTVFLKKATHIMPLWQRDPFSPFLAMPGKKT